MTYRCSPRYVTASSPRVPYASPDTPSNRSDLLLNPWDLPGEYFATTGMRSPCSRSLGDLARRRLDAPAAGVSARCLTSKMRTNGSSHPRAKSDGEDGSKARSLQPPWTLRSTTTSPVARGAWRRSKRRTRPSWCVASTTSGLPGTNRTFMPMTSPSSFGSVGLPAKRDLAAPSFTSSSSKPKRRVRKGLRPEARGSPRLLAADWNPRTRSTTRTSPSPAVVTHRPPRVPGTNSALNMLWLCPVYTVPRHGNDVPTLHTHTHRSSLPESRSDASSLHATVLTHPACLSRRWTRRRFLTKCEWPNLGRSLWRGSHSRRRTSRYADVGAAFRADARGVLGTTPPFASGVGDCVSGWPAEVVGSPSAAISAIAAPPGIALTRGKRISRVSLAPLAPPLTRQSSEARADSEFNLPC